MSYDLHLIDPSTREVLEADEKHTVIGDNYVIGGTRELGFLQRVHAAAVVCQHRAGGFHVAHPGQLQLEVDGSDSL